MTTTQAQHLPIREFSRLTGVNAVTLRAWERRYGIIKPLRSDKGHRYYTDEHVQRVKAILYWLEQGYAIRQVKLLLSQPAPTQTEPQSEWQTLQSEMMTEARRLHTRQLEALWNGGLASYPMAVYYERCLLPVLDQLRANSQQSLLAHAFEHLLKAAATLISTQQRNNDGPNLLMATNHENAELTLLASGYALGAAGWRVNYFGPKLSAPDVQISLSILDASWLWIHLHPASREALEPWLKLAREASVPVFLSGALPDHWSTDENTSSYRLPDDMGGRINQVMTRLAAHN